MASSLVGAGCSRFASRSFIYASYCGVPRRGGASAGKPPAHCGRVSLTPAASFSLTDAQPPKAKPASASARIVAIWRALTGIGRMLKPWSLKKMDLGPHGGPDAADRPLTRLERPWA